MVCGIKPDKNVFHFLVPTSGPNITDINAISSTSISISWGNVSEDDANGIITLYFVCYQVESSQDDICSVKQRVDGVNYRSTVLSNLKPFTTYAVAVQAATSKGAGTPGKKASERTLEDSTYYTCTIYYLRASDALTP